MKLYLDSSALVKLVQPERETPALRRYLRRHRGDELVTSMLSRVEVLRAIAPGGAAAIALARRQLDRFAQLALTADLLDRAAVLAPTELLRTLDAIHLAAAQTLAADLRAIVTYDRRMAAAALQVAVPVQAPG